MKQVPCQWDFPRLEPDEWALPEVKVGTWGGFVFINMDPDCDTLESHLGDLSRHFDRWPLEDASVDRPPLLIMPNGMIHEVERASDEIEAGTPSVRWRIVERA